MTSGGLLSTAHSDDDIDRTIEAFDASVRDLEEDGLVEGLDSAGASRITLTLTLSRQGRGDRTGADLPRRRFFRQERGDQTEADAPWSCISSYDAVAAIRTGGSQTRPYTTRPARNWFVRAGFRLPPE